MVKNVRKFNILSPCLTSSPAPALPLLLLPAYSADIVSCTAVGKQTSTLVTITLELVLELRLGLEPPSEPTLLINLTGAFAACNLSGEQNRTEPRQSYEIQQAIKHMRAHAFFMRCWLLCPSQSSAREPQHPNREPQHQYSSLPRPGQLVLWLHLNLQ